MKRAREILKLPIISITEGENAGFVQDLLIDPASGSVKFLVAKDTEWYLGASLLPFEKIKGIGIDVITTANKNNIKKFNETDKALEYARKDVKIIGTSVYDEMGEYKGVIDEIILNENDGTICGCELLLKDTQEKVILPSSSIITYSKQFIIVINNVEDSFVKDIDNNDIVNSLQVLQN